MDVFYLEIGVTKSILTPTDAAGPFSSHVPTGHHIQGSGPEAFSAAAEKPEITP